MWCWCCCRSNHRVEQFSPQPSSSESSGQSVEEVHGIAVNTLSIHFTSDSGSSSTDSCWSKAVEGAPVIMRNRTKNEIGLCSEQLQETKNPKPKPPLELLENTRYNCSAEGKGVPYAFPSISPTSTEPPPPYLGVPASHNEAQ